MTPSPSELNKLLEQGWIEDVLPRLEHDQEAAIRRFAREQIISAASTHLNQEPFARIERVRRPL